MWRLGLKPYSHAKVAALIAATAAANVVSAKTCDAMAQLLREHLSHDDEAAVFELELLRGSSVGARLTDAQARTIAAVMGPGWCVFAHVSLRGHCAIPQHYKGGPFGGLQQGGLFGGPVSARAAKAESLLGPLKSNATAHVQLDIGEAAARAGLTREAVAGLLAFAYEEFQLPGIAQERDGAVEDRVAVLAAAAYLDAAAVLVTTVRAHGRCVCCDSATVLDDRQVCQECFKRCGDRTPATEAAMWHLGFKPRGDRDVAALCEALWETAPADRTCETFRSLVTQKLPYVYKGRLNDAQARAVRVALGAPDLTWCALVHVSLRSHCAVPANYEFGPFPGISNSPSPMQPISVRLAKAQSTAESTVCATAQLEEIEAVGYVNTCAAWPQA
ncbi:hypothetical protein HYH03_015383 [Edaphochlamys debaryana]|uniref:Uncharacterized protein n=1 Tax=Edaphochlamys debaryana TaxID=47281 RepID=A0A835XLY7_9CHLO|nr:hypothetical protein HYH03_015383 [Edaphochlamys debaryana]|eukprot:KAG2485939.1 hypothetical protein HYH03_015383 [Edaphochlamys debaryana]